MNERASLNERGSGLVELALILPVILILTLAIVQFAMLGFAASAADSAARQGARVGSVAQINPAGQALAEAQRVAMTARTLEFFGKYDLLLTPATIVPPFPVENRYVAECDGKKFDNYVEWLAIVYAITLACCPALSLPCGFTASGLPVGLQMVAAPRGEARLLAGAKLLEDILGLRGSTPIDPRAPK